jgi:Protein of unknown function (DUF3307).
MNPFHLILGHLLGDFVLQNNWMAMRKGAKLFPCLVHCFIYTACVGFLTTLNPYWLLVVFLSHFFIDRYSLADKWLKLINGRSLEVFIHFGHMGIPDSLPENEKQNYRILRGSFAALVYTAVDNTFHFILMALGYLLLKHNNLLG